VGSLSDNVGHDSGGADDIAGSSPGLHHFLQTIRGTHDWFRRWHFRHSLSWLVNGGWWSQSRSLPGHSRPPGPADHRCFDLEVLAQSTGEAAKLPRLECRLDLLSISLPFDDASPSFWVDNRAKPWHDHLCLCHLLDVFSLSRICHRPAANENASRGLRSDQKTITLIRTAATDVAWRLSSRDIQPGWAISRGPSYFPHWRGLFLPLFWLSRRGIAVGALKLMTIALPNLHIDGHDGQQIVQVRSVGERPAPSPGAPTNLGDYIANAIAAGIKPIDIQKELIKLPIIK